MDQTEIALAVLQQWVNTVFMVAVEASGLVFNSSYIVRIGEGDHRAISREGHGMHCYLNYIHGMAVFFSHGPFYHFQSCDPDVIAKVTKLVKQHMQTV